MNDRQPTQEEIDAVVPESLKGRPIDRLPPTWAQRVMASLTAA